jgi:hypothetical protein
MPNSIGRRLIEFISKILMRIQTRHSWLTVVEHYESFRLASTRRGAAILKFIFTYVSIKLGNAGPWSLLRIGLAWL